ncbi:MAG: hypothetical protein ACREH4_12395, partial [Vitreimonas sp.]
MSVLDGALLQTLAVGIGVYLALYALYFAFCVILTKVFVSTDAISKRRFLGATEEQKGTLVGAVLT